MSKEGKGKKSAPCAVKSAGLKKEKGAWGIMAGHALFVSQKKNRCIRKTLR